MRSKKKKTQKIKLRRETEAESNDIVLAALEKAGQAAKENPSILNPRQMVKQFLLNKGKPSVQKALNDYLLDYPEKLRLIARTFVNEAVRGNMDAIKEILNRLDGKVAEVHRIDSENPVTLIFAPAAQLLAQKIETQNVLSAGAEPEKVATAPFEVIEPEEIKVERLPLLEFNHEPNLEGQPENSPGEIP